MPQSKKPQSKKKNSSTTLVTRPNRHLLRAVFMIAGVCVVGMGTLAMTYAANPKAFASDTDYGHYPKLVGPADGAAQSHTPQKDASDDSVYAIVKTSATESKVDAYDPVPGESKQSLYTQLKSQNVAGLINPDTDMPDSAPPGTTKEDAYQMIDPGGAGGSDCWADGYARGECAAWKNNGYAHPQIYFIDHSSSQWPVAAATYKWNQAHGIDSVYRWGTCPSIRGIHCVPVNSGNYGKTGWEGHTTWYHSGSIMTSAHIYLNTWYNGQVASYLGHASAHTACHEEGHALGLNHNHFYTSCMYPDAQAGSTVPTGQDFSLLSTIYSIRR